LSGSITDLDEAQPPLLVKVDGGKVAVDGLQIEHLLYLTRQFPAFMRRILGVVPEQAPEGGSQQTTKDIADAIQAEPNSTEIIAEIAACSNGHQGEKKVIARAKRFRAFDQLRILNATLERTFEGNDPGPFVEAVTKLMSWLSVTPPPIESSESDSSSSAGELKSAFPLTAETES
jgi:hypothetical protein